MTCPRAEAWSGVTLGVGLAYDDLELWLVSALPEFALMAATHPHGTERQGAISQRP